jgi:uncharacterized membrane protein
MCGELSIGTVTTEITSSAVGAGVPSKRRAHAMPSHTATRRTLDWLVPAGLLLLSAVPFGASVFRIADLAGGEVTAENARHVAAPVPIVLHVTSTAIYSVVGAFQFSRGFRRRHRRWHRSAGRVLVAFGLAAALSGMWLTLASDLPASDGPRFGALGLMRLVVGVAMATGLVLAVATMRRRDTLAHGAWMTRAYALGLGAGTQAFTHLPWAVAGAADAMSETERAVAMGAGWLINIVVAEWIIRRRRQPHPRRGAPQPIVAEIPPTHPPPHPPHAR